MAIFEVGKSYENVDIALDPITVIRRTQKTITVQLSTGIKRRMMIRRDSSGSEYVIDSSVPKRHCGNKYSAEWEVM